MPISLRSFIERIRYETDFRYHFCQWCGKFLLKKSCFCKKCSAKYEKLPESEKEAFWKDDYDPWEDEEIHGYIPDWEDDF